MPDAVKLILSLSVSGSTLALLLFALKRAFRNRLPKAFQYYVWLVVLLRLALPVSFGFSAVDSIFRAIPGISADTSASAALSAGIYRPNKPILVQPGEVFSFNERVRASDESGAATRAADYLLLVWLAGAAIALGIKVFGYARFSARLKKAHRSARPCEEQALKRLHSGKIAIERNPLARTPMLMGLFRPVIVLPDRAYSSEELICVLEHELTHYKRLDIPLKWLSLLVCCAHWFNPPVEIADGINARKQRMIELADAFCILPGGVGTLNELTDILQMQQVGETKKPVFFLNTSKYWDIFGAVLVHMDQAGFIPNMDDLKIKIAADPNELIDQIKNFVA